MTVQHRTSLPLVLRYNGPTAPVAGGQRIAVLQGRLVDLLPHDSCTRARPCPIDAGSRVEARWWHGAFDDDLEHVYLRDLMVRAAGHALGADSGEASTRSRRAPDG